MDQKWASATFESPSYSGDSELEAAGALEILFWHALVFRKSQPWSFLNGHKWKMLPLTPSRRTPESHPLARHSAIEQDMDQSYISMAHMTSNCSSRSSAIRDDKTMIIPPLHPFFITTSVLELLASESSENPESLRQYLRTNPRLTGNSLYTVLR